MKSQLLLVACAVWLISSCDQPVNVGFKSPEEESARSLPQAANLTGLIKRLPRLSLPLKYDLGFDEAEGVEVSLDELRLLAGDPDLEVGAVIGLLPTTESVHHVLWFFPADQMLPMVSTFSLDGELINVEGIALGECHPLDCYFCRETVAIDRNLRIQATDTIRDCVCDSVYSPILDSCQHLARHQEGLITARGVMLAPIRQNEFVP